MAATRSRVELSRALSLVGAGALAATLVASLPSAQAIEPGTATPALSRWLDAAAPGPAARRRLESASQIGCEGSTVLRTPRGEMSVPTSFLAIPPSRYEERTRVQGTEIHTTLDEPRGWVERASERRPLDDGQLERMRGARHRRYGSLMVLAARGMLTASVNEDGSILVESADGPLRLSVDASGLVIQMSLAGRSLRGEAVVERRSFSDFRWTESGVRLPYRVTIDQDGREVATSVWEHCAVELGSE